MDFTQFDSRAAAENGAWLHLRHPATNDLLFGEDGQPSMVKVMGLESKSAIAEMSRQLRDKKAVVSASDLEARHIQNVKSAKTLIMAFENCTGLLGKPLTAPDDVEWFLGLGIPVGGPNPDQRTFAEQVNAFAADRSNYLGNGLKP